MVDIYKRLWIIKIKPCDVAKTIIDNVINETNLTVADIIIERN